jgi:hypothetical protein
MWLRVVLYNSTDVPKERAVSIIRLEEYAMQAESAYLPILLALNMETACSSETLDSSC